MSIMTPPKKKPASDRVKPRTVTMPDTLWHQLLDMAKEQDRSPSYLVRKAIEEFVARSSKKR